MNIAICYKYNTKAKCFVKHPIQENGKWDDMSNMVDTFTDIVLNSCQDHTQMLYLAWELNIKLRPLKLVGHPTNPTGRQVGLRPTQKAASTLHVVLAAML